MARDFDGFSGRVAIAADAAIDDATVFTWAAWIQPDGLGEVGGGRIFDKGSKRLFLTSTATIRAGVDRATTPSDVTAPNNTLTFGQLHFVAATYDEAVGVFLYVGALGGTLAQVGGPGSGAGATTADAGNELAIGNLSGADARTFDGRIWGARAWYGAALSREELQAAMYGAVVPPDALEAWLRMVGLSPEPDFSGKGRTGTVTGAAAVASPFEALAMERGSRRVGRVRPAAPPPGPGQFPPFFLRP